MSVISRRSVLRALLLSGAAGALRPIDLLALDTQPGELKRVGPQQTILVVGAGMAGLIAAYELKRAGHEVRVLEAGSVAGGRVHTVRAPFTENLYGEAGAARIPDSHELTLRYIERFGLELAPFQPLDRASTVHVQGKNYRSDDPDLLRVFGCSTTEQTRGPRATLQRLSKPVRQRVGSLEDPAWPTAAALEYDELNGAQLLRQMGVSDGLTRFLDMGFGVLGQLSGLDLAIQLESLMSRKYRVRGGNDSLPRAIAAELEEQIDYGAVVDLVSQSRNSVTVRTRGTNGGKSYEADRVIVTVPLPTMARIEFRPGLSRAKRDAIDECRYARVTRVFAQVKSRFWEREGLSGFAVSDHPFEVFNASYGNADGGLLVGYFHEDLAERIERGLPGAGVDVGIRLMSEVFRDLPRHTTTTAAYSWHANAHARGAVALWQPGDFRKIYPQLAAPEGRVLFAGEHCSPWHSWIQGAIHSGIRAAIEVNEV